MAEAKSNDLAEHLDAENMGEFEKHKSQADIHCDINPLAPYELFNANKDKSKLTSSPPVKLHVSRIPPKLNINGMRNIFSQYGELRDVSQPRMGINGHSEFNYAFVSYSNIREALAAIENLSQRAPLYMEVKLSHDEQEAIRKRRMDELEKFIPKAPYPMEEEEDWDKEIEEREKMQFSVDRFQEGDGWGEESDIEIRAPGLTTIEEEKASNGAVQKLRGAKAKDSSGRTIFVETDLPETDLKMNSLANILEVKSNWALIRINGLRRQMNHLEDAMKEKSTEFLKSSPSVKQVCVFQRNGKFVRVVVDVVKDSGVVQIHGVDDGTRIKVADWRELRYISAGLMKLPPLCVMVKLKGLAPETEEVKIIYLGHRKGYPVVELTGASSDLRVESDRESSGHTLIDKENNAKTNTNSEVLDTTITQEVIPVSDKSEASGLVIGETLKLKVVHVESPREVYFLRSTDRESFSKFHQEMIQYAESLEFQADFSPEVGAMVFVKIDKIWYRAKVLSIEDPAFLHFYAVDFGFTEVVKMKRVRDIPETLGSFKTQRYFAVKCSLSGWEEGTPIHTEAELKDIRRKLPLSASSVKVTVINQDQKKGVYTVAIKNISRNAVSFQ